MSKAYSFYEFIDNNGKIDGLEEKTDKYRKIMNNPTRQSSFLVVLTYSNSIPPFIPDPPVDNTAELKIYSEGVNFTFEDTSIRVDYTAISYAKVILPINTPVLVNLSASQNYYIRQPNLTEGGISLSNTAWGVQSTQVYITITQDTQIRFESYRGSVPTDSTATLTVRTTADVEVVSGSAVKTGDSSTIKTISDITNRYFTLRFTVGNDKKVETYTKTIDALTIVSFTPTVTGDYTSMDMVVSLIGDSDITVVVVDDVKCTITISTDDYCTFSDNNGKAQLIGTNTYRLVVSQGTYITCTTEVISADYIISYIATNGLLIISRTNYDSYSTFTFTTSATTADIDIGTELKENTPEIYYDILTLNAPNCTVSSVTGLSDYLLRQTAGGFTISYQQQMNTEFSFVVTPPNGYKIDSATLSPLGLGEIISYDDLGNGSIRYNVVCDTSCNFTVSLSEIEYTLVITTNADVELTINNSEAEITQSSGKYTITFDSEYADTILGITVTAGSGFMLGSPVYGGIEYISFDDSTEGIYEISFILTVSNAYLNIPTITEPSDEWTDLQIITEIGSSAYGGKVYTWGGVDNAKYVKVEYKNYGNLDYRFKLSFFDVYNDFDFKYIGKFFARTVYVSPDNSSSAVSTGESKRTWYKFDTELEYYDDDNVWVVVKSEDLKIANPQNLGYIRFVFDDYGNTLNEEMDSDWIYYCVEMAQYNADPNNITQDEFLPEGSVGSNFYFDGNNIVDFSFTQEVDPTGETVPYSSCTIEIVDDNDEFNPLRKDENSRELSRYQQYSIYALARDPEGEIYEDIVGDVSTGNNEENAYWYITPLGRMRLDSVEQNNFNAVFNFIGNLEYFDNIFLNENEKRNCSHTTYKDSKEYLVSLFGIGTFSDSTLDALSGELILTPFEEESKTEIARIIAQYFGCYLSENEFGQIEFIKYPKEEISVDNVGAEKLYKIPLDNQFANPKFEPITEWRDGISFNVYNYNNNTYDETTRKDIKYTNISVYGIEILGTTDWKFLGTFDLKSNEVPNVSGTSNANNIYLDVGKDLEQNLKDFNANGLMVKIDFDEKYIPESIFFKPSLFISDSLYDEGEKKPLKINDFNELVKRITGSTFNRVQLSETSLFLYLYKGDRLIFNVPFINEHIDLNTSNMENLPFLYWFYCCAWSTVGYLGTLNGYPLSNDSIQYLSSKEQNATNVIEIDNPLITSVADARKRKQIIKNMYNDNTFQIQGNWVGDGTLNLNKKVLIGFPIGRGDGKTYENYYLATTVKREISSQGGFTEQSSFNLYSEKLYQMEEIDINGASTIIDSVAENGIYDSEVGKTISLKAKDEVYRYSITITV